MNIGLIAVDSKYPNLALMKISAFHRKQGDLVEWYTPFQHYDIVYISKVFTFTPDFDMIITNAEQIERGGTGYDVVKTLPDYIDSLQPDYDLYEIDVNLAYGFLTRGCPNHCKWCVVPKKEGDVKPYMDIEEIAVNGRNKVILMDNNILASDYGLSQIEKIVRLKLKVDFNQALDARLVTDEVAKMLAKVKMIVLSLFDGMSCGQIALRELGVTIEKYYASEVDKFAIANTMANFPETVQLGDVREIDATTLGHIDLLIGGSPCQSFSFAGKRAGMSTKTNEKIVTLSRYLELKKQGFEFEGQSYLFWEYVRILNQVRQTNPGVFFMLENVEMGKQWESVIDEAIGVRGVHINSALVSAQVRKRIYWTNIRTFQSVMFAPPDSAIPQPRDRGILLKDILEDEVPERYYLKAEVVKSLLAHKERNKEAGNGFGATPRGGGENERAKSRRQMCLRLSDSAK